MFTIQQIKETHARVQSGADFPQYVQDLIQLGLRHYDNFVSDGHVIYFGENDFKLTDGAKYPAMEVSDASDTQKLKHYLKIHQQGETNYPTFCSHAAEMGVEKWTVKMRNMTYTYCDKAGDKMVVEMIPMP